MITYKPVANYLREDKPNTGLGNQMFQVASTIGIAIKNNQEWRLPYWEHPFVYDFPISTETYPVYDVPWGYQDIKVDGDVALHGYMQAHEYFDHIEDFIREVFRFAYGYILNEPFIAIHVRRGDYTGISEHHTLLGKDYYDAALSLLPKDLKRVVFTDDKITAKEVVPSFYWMFDGSPEDDMRLMTKADYHVIANSSFSWWGAWLSKSKKVIAPKAWFGPKSAHLSTEDLIPKYWDQI